MHALQSLKSLKRAASVVVLLLTLLFSLTACIHLDRSVTINSDGSGSYVLSIGFSEQLVSLIGDQLNAGMDTFGAQVKQQGGSYRHYDETGYSYWAYTRPFKTIAQLNQLVQQTPQAENSSGGVSVTPQDTLNFSEQSGFLSNSFHVTGHMSLAFPQSDLSTPNGTDLTPYLKDMRETFAVTMPGAISSHRGGVVNSDTVTYTIHYGQQTTIDVVGGGFAPGPLAPLGIGALVIIALAVVGLLFWRRRRSRDVAPALAAVYSPTGSDAPTMPGQSKPSSGANQG